MTKSPSEIDPLIVTQARGADILAVAKSTGAQLKQIRATDEWASGCPTCGGKDTFSINTERRLFICRRGNAGGDVIAMAQHALSLGFVDAVEFITGEEARKAVRQEPPAPKPMATARDTRSIALAIWAEGVNPRDTRAERYLAGRGLALGDDVAVDVLRWNPRIGAMVALFRNITTGEPQAVSRTFLDPDGRKIERKFLGSVGGAAVMLDSFDAVNQGLHVGEGVETCLTARRLGLRPTWALGSCGAIEKLQVLGGVECLTILAEHDDASAKAVRACGAVWHAAGREVLINRPIGGKDLNDALRGAA